MQVRYQLRQRPDHVDPTIPPPARTGPRPAGGSSLTSVVIQSGRHGTMDSTAVSEHVGRVAEDGYTIVEDAIELKLLDALVDDLNRLVRDLGIEPAPNEFEGTKT